MNILFLVFRGLSGCLSVLHSSKMDMPTKKIIATVGLLLVQIVQHFDRVGSHSFGFYCWPVTVSTSSV